MTKLKLFNKLMTKAKTNGYTGPDYEFEIGRIMEGTNIYSLIFREDFAKAIWENMNNFYPRLDFNDTVQEWKFKLTELSISEDKWKYLEENTNLS